MFTGIIENMGLVKRVMEEGSNKTFWIESPLSASFTIDQSVSHDGVCLTVEEVNQNQHRVTAIAETLQKTVLGQWQPSHPVNLEQCLQPTGRLDGHFVQGHIDGTGICKKIVDKNGSYELDFSFAPVFATLIIEKGSICINGISLTAFNITNDCFTVGIIPYTWKHTNLAQLKPGDAVNLEFDLLGKYITRYLQLNKS